MSAIFGHFQRDGQPISPPDLDAMERALAHHGQDGGGQWMQADVGLGMRLRCFTPEEQRERQPLVSADRLRVLVADARLDNRDELTAVGRWPHTCTDSELILLAYEKWGGACVEHLVGVFAFALWDGHIRRLLLARSPMQAPTLFYAAAGDLFAFATMPSALHRLAPFPRQLNEQKLADFLVLSPADPEATLYRHIRSLPTGHTLTVGRESWEVRSFWQPEAKAEIRFPQDEDYLDAFRDLLERVVAAQLRSATPIGIFLSGGLDSSSVAATAAPILARRNQRLAAFTEVPLPGFDGPAPPGRYADETPYVRQIAAMVENLDLHLLQTPGAFFLDNLESLFVHLEAPFRNTSNRVWIEAILQEAAGQGIRVLLNGAQGNLSISWTGSGYLPSLLRSGQWGRAWATARTVAKQKPGGNVLRSLVGQGLLPLAPQPLWVAAQRFLGSGSKGSADPWRAWSPIHPAFAEEQQVVERAHAVGHDFRYGSRLDSRAWRQELLSRQDLGAFLTAHRSMYGVDVRSPLTDVRLVEFCLALPEEQYFYDGQPRALVRRAMAGRLPPAVLSNRKRGAQAADWFERMTAARSRIALEVAELRQSPLASRALDLDRMERLIAAWPSAGWDEQRIGQEYHLLLGSGLMVGRFLRWLER